MTTVNYTLFNQKITFDSLKSHLGSAVDILRGSLDPADYRQPIMTLLFIKGLNDTFEENAEKLIKEEGRSEKEAMRIKIGITFSVLKKQGGLSIPSNHIIYYKTLFGVLPKKKFNLGPYEKLECDCRKLKSLGALEKVGMKSINF